MPDLVWMTDIAGLIDCTRQDVRKLVLVDATFPTAVHESTVEMFHLADVLTSAGEHRGRSAFDGRSLEVATASREVN